MKPQSTSELDEILEHCREVTLLAGEIAMEFYGETTQVRIKSDLSPVTAADLAVDEFIREKLSSAFPSIPLVTEEHSASHLENPGKCFFLVDPIDGTKEFISRNGEFTINIALIEASVPVMGVIYAPAKQRFFYGAAGAGAFESHTKQTGKNIGNPRQIYSRPTPGNTLKMMVSRSHLDRGTMDFIGANPNSERITAGSSLKFCEVAAGRADIYPRFAPTMEWDTAAGHAVLLAAGGSVTDITGLPLKYGKTEYRNHNFLALGAGVEFQMPQGLNEGA